MAKYKGIKWAQVQTLMNAIAGTISNCATKSELNAASGAFKPTVSGSTLVFPAGSAAKFEGSTLVLTDY
jgi:hypothetical protein